MRNYWSCGSLADKIRGTPKLKCGTSKEWKEWEKEAKSKHKFRYWIAETALDKIQDIIMYPIDRLYDIKYWFLNRFVTKTHALTSNLKKGEWHEMDERILHCLFDELVNWVEVDLAWKHIAYCKEAREEYNSPWYALGFFRLRTWRNAAAGLSYLNWESKLIMDEDYGISKDDPKYGNPTPQAEKAIEVIRLYNWWRFKRPYRPDPYEISGWSEYCDSKNREDLWDFLDFEDETEEQKEKTLKMIEHSNEIEEFYYKEDTDNLISLINLRRNLWT